MLPIIKFLLDCFENILDTTSLFLTFFLRSLKKEGKPPKPPDLSLYFIRQIQIILHVQKFGQGRGLDRLAFLFLIPPGWFSSSIGLTSYGYIFCRAEYFSAKSWAPLVRKAHCVSLPLFGIAVRVDCKWFDASTAEQLNHCLPFDP